MCKRLLVLILVFLMALSVSACAEVVSDVNKDISDSLLITLDKGTYDANDAKIVVNIKNASEVIEYTYGEKVILEVKENGEYKSAGEDLIYNDMLYILIPLGESEMTVSLNEKFPDLSSGEYRLGITFNVTGSEIFETVFAKFTLE
ncbi:MAG: hypothetical protein IJ451_05655 [Ruminococcus sp.]|nr:hypothetical protein [Ruminococcus sp.]